MRSGRGMTSAEILWLPSTPSDTLSKEGVWGVRKISLYVLGRCPIRNSSRRLKSLTWKRDPAQCVISSSAKNKSVCQVCNNQADCWPWQNDIQLTIWHRGKMLFEYFHRKAAFAFLERDCTTLLTCPAWSLSPAVILKFLRRSWKYSSWGAFNK